MMSIFTGFLQTAYRKTTAAASVLAVVFYILDQITKEIIVRSVPPGTMTQVIRDFFYITHVTNPGAAWGILSGRGWLLLAISFAAFAGIVIFLRKLTDEYPERIFALLAVCSGIAGNCTDRIFRGEVVDFLLFYLGSYQWPAFNVADICISCGVSLFVISSVLRPERAKKKD